MEDTTRDQVFKIEDCLMKVATFHYEPGKLQHSLKKNGKTTALDLLLVRERLLVYLDRMVCICNGITSGHHSSGHCEKLTAVEQFKHVNSDILFCLYSKGCPPSYPSPLQLPHLDQT